MTRKNFPAVFTLLLVFALGAVTASAAIKTVIIKTGFKAGETKEEQ